MSVAESIDSKLGEPAVPVRATARRPLRKRIMHVVRRGHLYFGLFLVPWVLLYGATGFLFNHPTAFSDQPTASFGRSELVGTPMENPPSPAEVAEQVVALLKARANPPVEYRLVQPEKAKYTREFAFATVKADDREVSVLIDVNGKGGTVRSRNLPAVPPAPTEKAPFATSSGLKGGATKSEKGGPAPRSAPDSPKLDSPIHERVRSSIPTILERTGFASGDVIVTSVPELSFHMADTEKTWIVTYNAMTGTVSGKPADEPVPSEDISTRRFLTRLHLSHGFPGDQNARWFWALIVDAMAFVMVFWGISGLFMWWQIKATRKIGFLVLLLSIAAATALGFGMHDVMTAR